MALQWTLDAATYNPTGAVYLSAEDQLPRVYSRCLAVAQRQRPGECRLEPRALRTQKGTGEERVIAERWAGEVLRARWVPAAVKRLRDILGILSVLPQGTAVAVDYLQALTGTKGQDRRNAIREAFAAMTEVSRARGLILLVVSQIRRPKDAKPGWEPSKFDLKESSDIEDSADNVVMLWRPVKEGSAPAHVKVEKCKDAPQCSRWLLAQQGTDRLVELAHG